MCNWQPGDIVRLRKEYDTNRAKLAVTTVGRCKTFADGHVCHVCLEEYRVEAVTKDGQVIRAHASQLELLSPVVQ